MESHSSDGRTLRYAPFAEPAPRDRAQLIPQGAADPPADDDFPLVERFLHELPSIEDYLEDYLVDAPVVAQVAPTPMKAPMEQDSEGWALTGWQSYAWESLANLGRPKNDRMSPDEAGNPEPWPVSIAADPGPSPDEVAAALDDIAQRIRSGELSIDQFRSSPPEAAMAAVIAAMLRLQG